MKKLIDSSLHLYRNLPTPAHPNDLVKLEIGLQLVLRSSTPHQHQEMVITTRLMEGIVIKARMTVNFLEGFGQTLQVLDEVVMQQHLLQEIVILRGGRMNEIGTGTEMYEEEGIN